MPRFNVVASSKEKPLLLKMRSIARRFPSVLALSEVDLTVRQGEVMALVSDNGAGKSTLIKFISDRYTCDTGEIIFQGQPVNFTTHTNG